MEWYKTGEEGSDQAKKKDEQRQRSFDTPFRFWLPPDKGTRIVFLDTKGFFFSEHQFKVGGSWKNWETCITDIGEEDCPLCESGLTASYVCVFSIIDLSKYTDKRGNKVTAMKKLLVLKSMARVKVLKQKERREDNLTGCVFEVTRFKASECSTGEDFEFLHRAAPEEVKETCPDGEDKEKWLEPFNYVEMFKPKSAEELRVVIGRAQPVGAEDTPTSRIYGEKKEGNGTAPKTLQSLV